MTRPRAAIAPLIVGFAAVVSMEAAAGPREARTRWKEAQALENTSGTARASWRERAIAFRAVRREAAETDPYYAKALAAEATVLVEAAHSAAAHAARAAAASLGPRHEPDRFTHVLTAARALLADEDPRGARPLLDDVVESGGSAAPAFTGPALELLGRLAADERDAATLARLSRRAADLAPARVDVRLALLDLFGVLALDRGDRRLAERTLAEERRLYDAARREGADAERVASRAWLSLTLPKRLDAR